jgi:hypothetical protein
VSLLILVCVILLPIVPAFLLFHALPSKAFVSGPLEGLKINLGGAFAAYFAVVVLVIASHNILFPVPPPISPVHVWYVRAHVTDEAGKPIEPLGSSDIALQPSPLMANAGGEFVLKFYSGEEFPKLAVSHNDGKIRFESHLIDLNPNATNDVVITRSGQNIYIERINLHRITADYDPPNVILKQLPYAAETAPSGPESHP